MPSTSKSQQRLMGVAYAVKSGNMQISDVDMAYRDKVKDLVDGMTLKQLKDFAETKHEGLPEVAENITPANIGGMGPAMLPTATVNGSGDVPAGQGDAKKEYKKKRRKMKHLKTFESFVNEGIVNEMNSEAAAVLADEVNGELYTARLKGKSASIKATTTTKTWDDETPVLKYLARGSSKSVKFELYQRPFKVVHDVPHGWFYFTDGRKWYGLHNDDGYYEPSDLPFEMTID